MFETYFDFQRTPFSRDLPTKDLFLTTGTKELNARLRYSLKQRYFTLITGEIGAGKSTQIRLFAADVNCATCRLVYIFDSDLTPRNFYWEALHQLGQIPRFYRGDAKRQLIKTICELVDDHKKSLVILIDEAHLLSQAMLEEVRFLLNFQMDSYTPMSLVLIGQPELNALLKKQIFEAIMQRINIRYHLPAFSSEETNAYIEHHLCIAGVDHSLFTQGAIALIHEGTGGVARKINNLCSAALLDAAMSKRRLIDDHMIRVVMENEFGI